MRHNVKHNATAQKLKSKIDIVKEYFVTHFCTPGCSRHDRNYHLFPLYVLLDFYKMCEKITLVFRMRTFSRTAVTSCGRPSLFE